MKETYDPLRGLHKTGRKKMPLSEVGNARTCLMNAIKCLEEGKQDLISASEHIKSADDFIRNAYNIQIMKGAIHEQSN